MKLIKIFILLIPEIMEYIKIKESHITRIDVWKGKYSRPVK